MHVPCIPCLSNEPHSHALTCVHETLMHRANREWHRDRSVAAIGVSVADNQDRRTAPHCSDGVTAQPVQGAGQTFRTGRCFPHRAHRRELRTGSAPHCGHLLGQQNWMLDAQQTAPARRSEEHTSELQSPCNLVCRLLLEKKKKRSTNQTY